MDPDWRREFRQFSRISDNVITEPGTVVCLLRAGCMLRAVGYVKRGRQHGVPPVRGNSRNSRQSSPLSASTGLRCASSWHVRVHRWLHFIFCGSATCVHPRLCLYQVKLPTRRSFIIGSPCFRDSTRSISNSATQSLYSSGSTSICWTRQVFLSSDGST